MRDEMAFLDQYIAPGLRLWMLIGLVFGVLLIMVVIVCCFIRIRIPRTKRQIELVAAQRKMRKTKSGVAASEKQEQDNDGYNFRNTGGSVPTTADPRTSNNGRRKDVLASRSIPV